jgi:hypothetical protein
VTGQTLYASSLQMRSDRRFCARSSNKRLRLLVRDGLPLRVAQRQAFRAQAHGCDLLEESAKWEANLHPVRAIVVVACRARDKSRQKMEVAGETKTAGKGRDDFRNPRA